MWAAACGFPPAPWLEGGDRAGRPVTGVVNFLQGLWVPCESPGPTKFYW